MHGHRTDTNECEQAISPCDDNADCHNTDGSFFCVCFSGYTGNGTDCKGIIISYSCLHYDHSMCANNQSSETMS